MNNKNGFFLFILLTTSLFLSANRVAQEPIDTIEGTELNNSTTAPTIDAQKKYNKWLIFGAATATCITAYATAVYCNYLPRPSCATFLAFFTPFAADKLVQSSDSENDIYSNSITRKKGHKEKEKLIKDESKSYNPFTYLGKKYDEWKDKHMGYERIDDLSKPNEDLEDDDTYTII